MASATLHLDAVHKVLTPEYVEFDFVLAGMMSRFLAWLLDTLVTTVVAVAAAIVIQVLALIELAATKEAGLAAAAFFVVWFLIDWGYFILLEAAWSGQTLGKRAMGLRVIQESGVRVGFYQSVLRNLARPVDRLPLLYLVGGVCASFTAANQRLGDLLAGTIVVRERRLKIPSALARPDGDTTLLADPDFRARVAKLTSEEESALFAAALRREELGIEARLHLFATLAHRLQEEVGFFKPPHLSDEKLCLLVTAALAARSAERSRSARSAKPRRFLQR
jgi:uncharacterized RDD family membrane protein YckC